MGRNEDPSDGSLTLERIFSECLEFRTVPRCFPKMSGRVFIGKIPYNTSERELEDWLSGSGFKKIDFINIKKGYAFVDFRDIHEAEACVSELNRATFMRSRVTVEMARISDKKRYDDRDRDRDSRHRSRDRSPGHFRDRFGAPYNTKWRVIIKNLSSRCEWRDLKDFFRQVGTVTYAESHKKRQGEGIVDFAHRDDVSKAIEQLDGTELMGRRIQIIDAISSDRDSRERSPRRRSRSRSGGYGRGSRQRRDRDAPFRSAGNGSRHEDDRDSRSRYSPAPRNPIGGGSRYRRDRHNSDGSPIEH